MIVTVIVIILVLLRSGKDTVTAGGRPKGKELNLVVNVKLNRDETEKTVRVVKRAGKRPRVVKGNDDEDSVEESEKDGFLDSLFSTVKGNTRALTNISKKGLRSLWNRYRKSSEQELKDNGGDDKNDDDDDDDDDGEEKE